MKSVFAGSSCTAAILAFGIAAYAQTTGQTPSQPTTQPSSQPTAQAQTHTEHTAQQVTIAGCVQREADYRRARGAGQGGALGTGVGAGNEFVLVSASTSGSASGSAATTAPGTTPGMPSTAGSPTSTTERAPTGTTGTTGTATAVPSDVYEISGPAEGQLQQFVGRRVEVTGKLKPHTGPARVEMTGAKESGTATGSVSVKKGNVDPLGQDLNLHEIEVVSVREATGTCNATDKR
jgi:hypothetical protein